jgi:hypothetical protein
MRALRRHYPKQFPHHRDSNLALAPMLTLHQVTQSILGQPQIDAPVRTLTLLRWSGRSGSCPRPTSASQARGPDSPSEFLSKAPSNPLRRPVAIGARIVLSRLYYLRLQPDEVPGRCSPQTSAIGWRFVAELGIRS